MTQNPLLDRESSARLPNDWPVGVSVVDRIHWIPDAGQRTPRTLTTIHPIPDGTRGRLFNMNALGFDDPLPMRFIIGDGTVRRALVGVDRTPGSPLSKWLERTRYQIEHFRSADQALPDAVLNALRQQCAGNMGPVRGDRNDGGAALPWDERIPPKEFVHPDLSWVPWDQAPVPLKFNQPVVPLEEYLKRCEGYCLQQSVFAALVLRLFGVRSRIANGATAHFEPASLGANFDSGKMSQPGHAWVELENDRILDPLAGILDKSTVWRFERPSNYPTRIFTRKWAFLPSYRQFVDGQWVDSWRFNYDRYFALDLDGRTPHVPR